LDYVTIIQNLIIRAKSIFEKTIKLKINLFYKLISIQTQIIIDKAN